MTYRCMLGFRTTRDEEVFTVSENNPAVPLSPSRPSQTGLPDQEPARGAYLAKREATMRAAEDAHAAISGLFRALLREEDPTQHLDALFDAVAHLDTAAMESWEAR